jgi:hypothetical protein
MNTDAVMIAGFGPPLLRVHRAALVKKPVSATTVHLDEPPRRGTHGLMAQKAKRKDVLSQLTLLSVT